MNLVQLPALKHQRLQVPPSPVSMPDPKSWLSLAGGITHHPSTYHWSLKWAWARPLWEGSGQPPSGPLFHSSAHGQIQLDSLLCDGFLCLSTTKVHQAELRGFNASNCGAKRSIIGLSNESGENAIENEVALPLNSSKVMALICTPESVGLPSNHA